MAISISQFKRDLVSVRIQGAMAVARATLQAFGSYTRSVPAPRKKADWAKLLKVADTLATVRPTEPLARNVVRWYVHELQSYVGTTSSQAQWRGHAGSLARAILEYLNEVDDLIVTAGQRLVRPQQTIFTHCHSSITEHILVAARRAQKHFHVYHTETRPLFQGRITDKRLRAAHIPAVMVADSAAAFLISKHSGDTVNVDWVLLGADSIARDGSVLNKIGSFGIALAAHDSKIPVYVATPLLKIDWHTTSTFELRPGSELWPNAPAGTQALNFAFDRVPAPYIKGIICEFGIIKPSQVARLVKQHYPWITRRS